MWKPKIRVPDPLGGLEKLVEDGPVVQGEDRCRCVCHKNIGVMHCKPCCRPCPNCRQNIVDGKFEEHLKKCLLTGGRNP